jgi:segregation and condensation protein B
MPHLLSLFAEEDEQPDADSVKAVLDELSQDYADRGIELKEVGSGFRIQAKQAMGQWLNRMNEEKPTRYSRALLETLALMAYRQPITRAGVEDIRGVSISSSIIKTLLEREWIRVVGHRDVPGRPALYGTTKQFLDYFNLKSLTDLPPLVEMRSIEDIQSEFDLNFNNTVAAEFSEDNLELSALVEAMPDNNAVAQRAESDAEQQADSAASDIDTSGTIVEAESNAEQDLPQAAESDIDEPMDDHHPGSSYHEARDQSHEQDESTSENILTATSTG